MKLLIALLLLTITATAQTSEPLKFLIQTPNGGTYLTRDYLKLTDYRWINANGGISYSGNVGIGTNTPTASMDINGTFRLRGNNVGEGKVLTSDASGNATWQTPTGTTYTFSNTGTIPVANNNGTISASFNWNGQVSAGDIEITDIGKGIILKSPNGTRRRITLNNDGTLSTSAPL